MIEGTALEGATRYNQDRGYTRAEIREIQRTVGSSPDGLMGDDTTRKIAEWQGARGLTADGKLGPSSWAIMLEGWWCSKVFDEREQLEVCEPTIKAESGGARYAAHNRDKEFRYSGYTYHVGSSIGLIQFSQDSGNLGKVLLLHSQLDRAGFVRLFGGQDDADALLDITTRTGPRQFRIDGDRGKRRPCVMPVAGFDLWDDAGPWVERLRRAADDPAHQEAQRMVMRLGFLAPAWALAQRYGWTSQSDVAIIFDICVQMGPSYIPQTLWPLVERERPTDARALLEHLRQDHRERRLRVFSDMAWWQHYQNTPGQELAR